MEARLLLSEAKGVTTMIVYIVVVEDRHIDTAIFPYSSLERALEEYESYIDGLDQYDPADVGADMNYYIRHFQYNCEGDCIYIIKKEIDLELEC